MIRGQRMSIHKKLALALWGTTLLAFAVAAVALALFGRLSLEGRARQTMGPYAQLVSVGAEAAVAFEDPVRAQEILATLRSNPQVLGAALVLRDGRLLADYHRGARVTFQPFQGDGVYLYENNAEFQELLQDDAHLHLVMNLDEFNRQTRNMLFLFAMGVFVLLVSVTLGLRTALHRTIIRPVSTLAETVEQVRTLADYHRRVPASGDDEVGRLGLGFNAMMEVIQEREDDLRQLTLFQQTILDNAAYGIIATASDGLVSSFNRAAERLLGYTADEVVGTQTPAYWHDPAEVTQRALELTVELGTTVPPGFEVFTARPRRNLPEEHEWTFVRKDGARVPVLLSVTALRNGNGQPTGFVGLTYDLTERKRAEEERWESEARYRRIVDTATEGIWVLGRDSLTSFVNTRMAEMLGYSAQELNGRPMTDFMFEEDAPDHRSKIENRHHGLSENFERRFHRKNGETVWTLVSATPIFDDSHTFQGSFAMFTDITERKQAEEELRRLKDDLEQRVKQRTFELEETNAELHRMNRLFVGRELRMAELKVRINALEGKKDVMDTAP